MCINKQIDIEKITNEDIDNMTFKEKVIYIVLILTRLIDTYQGDHLLYRGKDSFTISEIFEDIQLDIKISIYGLIVDIDSKRYCSVKNYPDNVDKFLLKSPYIEHYYLDDTDMNIPTNEQIISRLLSYLFADDMFSEMDHTFEVSFQLNLFKDVLSKSILKLSL